MSRHPATAPHVAIVGAGPTGLDAALAAAERGWSFTLYEAAERPAGNVRGWGHVRLFSPWSIDASPRMRRALAAAGAAVPEGDDCPTGHELADRVLDPVAALPSIAPRLALGARVEAIARDGLLKSEEIGSAERRRRPFRLLVAAGDGSAGTERTERIDQADAVVDATGGLATPNRVGADGIPCPGERANEEAIERRLPDLAADGGRWAGRSVLLVGGGHSAQTAARDLARLAEQAPGTRVVWALRREEPRWEIEDDPLPERSRLAAEAGALARGASPTVEAHRGVVVGSLARRGDRVAAELVPAGGRPGAATTVEVDRVLALTGATGDHALYRELQVHECYASGAPMKLAAALLGAAGGDCMTQSGFGPETLLNPEPRFFILGAKSYGRSPAYLMRIGWEQVDDAFGLLDADFAEAPPATVASVA